MIKDPVRFDAPFSNVFTKIFPYERIHWKSILLREFTLILKYY